MTDNSAPVFYELDADGIRAIPAVLPEEPESVPVGEVIGQVLSTDIRTYIDGAEIPGLLWSSPPNPDEEMLTPVEFQCVPDAGSRLVMFANAAQGHPEAACRRLACEIYGKEAPSFNMENRKDLL